MKPASDDGWRFCLFHAWDWSPAGIAPALSREEAHFWFSAMARLGSGRRRVLPESVAADLAGEAFDGALTLEEALAEFERTRRAFPPEVMPVLANLFPLEEALERILAFEAAFFDPHHSTSYRLLWTDGFRADVLPYLTAPEREALRETVRGALARDPAPATGTDPPGLSLFLAACLGLHAEVAAITAGWEADRYRENPWARAHQRPQELLFGLGSPGEVSAGMRRLELHLEEPEDVAAWLAHTGYGGLDWVRESIAAARNKKHAEVLFRVLARVTAPETAPEMLALADASRVSPAARKWLDGHPAETIAGLVPIAKQSGERAEAAAGVLRGLSGRGFTAEAIAAAVERAAPGAVMAKVLALDPEAAARPVLEAESEPEWLREALMALDASSLPRCPAWADPAGLPPIPVEERALSPEHTRAVVAALRLTPPAGPPPSLLVALKAHAGGAALDEFVERLFERWLQQGAKGADSWAMRALGWLGSDALAVQLTAMIRDWSAGNHRQRAALGLQTLRAFGTDTALAQLHSLIAALPTRALQRQAREALEGLAADRGLTPEQLADRIIPDCGLDERGTRRFDYGPRQFHLVMGPGLTPQLQDESGAVTPGLPKPDAADDPARAAHAAAEWKRIKDRIATVTRLQATRLERAMVAGRRWTRGEFETCFVRHPLMRHVVATLAWGACGPDGALAATFRVTEDLTYADARDQPFDLSRYPGVRIVHPLHLTEAERAAWGEQLAARRIVPPFPQLERPVRRLGPEEAAATAITAFGPGTRERSRVPARAERGEGAVAAVSPTALAGVLGETGWTPRPREADGRCREYVRAFPEAGAAAVVRFDPGLRLGGRHDEEPQRLTRCYFLPHPAGTDGGPESALPLHRIAPVIVSEVLCGLGALISNGA